MDNVHYTNVMVDKANWKEKVGMLTAGEDVTARLVKEKTHGLLIRIGSSDQEALRRVQDRSVEIA